MPQERRTLIASDTAQARSRTWRERLLPRKMTRMLRPRVPRRRLALALQGGGSFGAFTWGVLDRLLEESALSFEAVSGTSAGAVNAVVFAHGLAVGGRDEARRRLGRFWERIGQKMPLAAMGGEATVAAASAALALSTQVISPYQFNPFGIDPLRDLLAEEIDFARLRAASPVRLLIAVTRVRDGRARLFREHEITLEVVLASACLPMLHHSVEIDGEFYWDGGYSANPPLRQLVMVAQTADVVLIQLTPEEEPDLPRKSAEIARRINQIAFNSPLQKEMEALEELAELCRQEGGYRSPLCRKLQQLRLHRIAAEDTVPGLAQASALNIDSTFLTQLSQHGRQSADAWLTDLPRRPAGG